MTAAFAIARAFLGKVPWQAWAALAAAIALLIFWNVAKGTGEAAVEAEVAKADRKAVETARSADEAAGQTVDSTQTEVEQTNDEARQAATGSDDPLADALRRLRGD